MLIGFDDCNVMPVSSTDKLLVPPVDKTLVLPFKVVAPDTVVAPFKVLAPVTVSGLAMVVLVPDMATSPVAAVNGVPATGVG
jgi:hypothetical protein